MKRSNVIGVVLVAIFVAFFLWGRYADASELRLGLGFGVNHNSGARTQELMLTSTDRRWYGSVARIGGDRDNDYQYTRIGAGYRVNWRRERNFSPYLRMGVAYFDNEPTDLVSDTWAFDMALGFRLWNIVELEIPQHNSTAGRTEQNEGIDTVFLGVTFPFGDKK